MRFFKFLVPIVLTFGLANFIVAQQINGRFSTSFYSWERYTTEKTSSTITRFYQNLQFDASHEQFSFHTSLAGAIGSSPSLTDDGDLRVYNAYLRAKNIGNIVDINLGRIPVFAGVGIGIVDGVLLKAKFWDEKIILTGYGGENVPLNLRSKGFKEVGRNFLAGGQFVGYLFEGSKIGISYCNRNRLMDGYSTIRPDSIFNPDFVLIQPTVRKEQLIGADASYSYGTRLSAYGRFDYELNTDHVVRGEINTRLNATQKLSFTGTYIYREPRIPYHSFFSLFNFESINEYEGGIEYTICSPLTTFGRIAFVQYGEELSRRLTIGMNSTYGSVRYSGSNGYSGQLASFSADIMYPLLERKFIPTASASFATYRLDIQSGKREEIFAGSLGSIIRITSSFSFDAQVQWLKNKIAKDDVRAFGKVSYWFKHDFSRPQIKGEGE
jgi:hypothetical protein